VSWTGERVLYDAMGEPEAQAMLQNAAIFASSANRLATTMERLPDTEGVSKMLAELNGTLAETTPLLDTMRAVIGDLNQTLGATDRVLAPFQSRAVGGGPTDRTFDVPQYAAAIRDLGTTLRELNALLINTSRLVESPDLGARLGQAQDITATGMGRLADQGNRWIDRVFWRALFLVVAFFVALFGYRVAAARFAGWPRERRR
jgi:hypothetical protein